MAENEESNNTSDEPDIALVEPSITGRDAGQTGLDLLATHFIADTLRPGQDRTRVLYGGLTAATFYASAPWIKEKFGDLGDLSAEDLTMKDAAVIGGLAGIGGLAAYLLKPEEQQLMRVPSVSAEAKRPNSLLVAGSALYLAVSLFDSSRSEEFKTRQRAGLLSGLAAYTFGPEATEKVITYLSPDNESYRTRRAIAGGLALGTGGAMMRYVTK